LCICVPSLRALILAQTFTTNGNVRLSGTIPSPRAFL
jgi:hypothetical protein